MLHVCSVEKALDLVLQILDNRCYFMAVAEAAIAYLTSTLPLLFSSKTLIVLTWQSAQLPQYISQPSLWQGPQLEGDPFCRTLFLLSGMGM